MMKSNCFSVVLACALCSEALRIPFGQSRRNSLHRRNGFGKAVPKPVVNAVNGDNDDLTLSSGDDLIYMANITLGGNEYIVQLDTGSSDLWIQGQSSPLPNSSPTSTTLNATYGVGWAFGNISTAEVDLAGIKIPSQAYLDVSSAMNPALQHGADGILGLGFTSLSSIDNVVNGTGGSWGRSVLYNAFLDKPDEPNFITFALQRTTEPNDEVQGAFTVGELDPTYTAVTSANKLSTWPVVAPARWNVLLDSFIVGTQTYSVSSNVSNVPSGKAVVLLDSGTSYTYVPTDVANAIYGGIAGAVYDPTQGLWVVPCDAEIDMALQFGGQVYPLHPLDVSPKSVTTPNGCVGSFVPQAIAIGNGQFDWLIGDNFLRAVYSLYDFGDFDSNKIMGNPYIQLLSIIDPNEASQDFVGLRGGIARSNITYNASGGTNAVGGSGSTTLTLADSTADKLSKLVDYIPAVLGILGLNALALLVIAGVGICWMCRRRRGAGRALKKGRSSHLLNPRAPTPYPGGADGGAVGAAVDLGDGHQYERVSVNGPAEPEDMPFSPPEPPFHAYEGDTLRPIPQAATPGAGMRPYSMLSTQSGGLPRDYRVSAAGSDMTAFVPPSPPFRKDSGDRPKSIA